MSSAGPSEETLRRGHETRDVDARKITWFTIGFLVFAVITHVTIRWIQIGMERSEPESVAAETPTVKPHAEWPHPALEISRTEDLRQFRARQEAMLHSYQWTDRKQGVLRIPVERAMDLVLRENQNADAQKQGGGR